MRDSSEEIRFFFAFYQNQNYTTHFSHYTSWCPKFMLLLDLDMGYQDNLWLYCAVVGTLRSLGPKYWLFVKRFGYEVWQVDWNEEWVWFLLSPTMNCVSITPLFCCWLIFSLGSSSLIVLDALELLPLVTHTHTCCSCVMHICSEWSIVVNNTFFQLWSVLMTVCYSHGCLDSGRCTS